MNDEEQEALVPPSVWPTALPILLLSLILAGSLVSAAPSELQELVGWAVVATAWTCHAGLALLYEFSMGMKMTYFTNALAVLSLWLACWLLNPGPCDWQQPEGRELLWRLLVLGGGAALPLRPAAFAFLGQAMAMQHTALGFTGGCVDWSWIRHALQLHLLAAVLALLQCRQHGQWRLRRAVALLCASPAAVASAGLRTPLEEVVTYVELEQMRLTKFYEELNDRAIAALTRRLLQVLSLCVCQLQKIPTEEALEVQDQEQLRDQNIGGWIGSLGRSSLEVEKALSCLEKSQSREDELPNAELMRSASMKSVEVDHWELKFDSSLCTACRVGKWNFDALEVRKEHPEILRIVGWELLQNFSFVSRSALSSFLLKLEAKYSVDVPYHSNAHAADCANSFEVMLSGSGQELHPLRIASCYLAALGHDIGHPGFNNGFMMNSRHDLAVTYNDRSVLENFHAAELERLLAGRLLALPKALEQKERQVRIAYILSTDMSKHMQDLGDLRLKLGCKDFDPAGNPVDQQLATQWIFRAADISHSAKPWAIHQKWSMRVVQEFHEQGDRERTLDLPISPLCDREHFDLAKSQTGFLQFVCLPMWQELTRLENLLHHGVEVSPRKSMSLQPGSRLRPEPMSLMPELRESQSMSVEEPNPSYRFQKSSSSFSFGVAVRLLVECQENLKNWQSFEVLPNSVESE